MLSQLLKGCTPFSTRGATSNLNLASNAAMHKIMARIEFTDLFTPQQAADTPYRAAHLLKTRVQLFDNEGTLIQEYVTYGSDLSRSYEASNMAVKYIHFDILNPIKWNGEGPIMNLLTKHFGEHGNPVPFAAKGPVM